MSLGWPRLLAGMLPVSAHTVVCQGGAGRLAVVLFWKFEKEHLPK